MKCPRCHEGDLFATPAFSFRQPFFMPDKCPHCAQPYMPEPGFYYGSMFVSYIFMGWFCLLFLMFFHWVLDWSLTASFGLLVVVCLFLYVLIFRLARSIWINLIVKYDPTQSGKQQQQ